MLDRRSKKLIVQGYVDVRYAATVAKCLIRMGETPRSMSELTRLAYQTLGRILAEHLKTGMVTDIEEAKRIMDRITRDKFRLEDEWEDEL